MSLIDVCYEQIKDQYYYGLFGDFKLVIDKNTGCFNATKLCNLGGKRFSNWSQNIKSIELINFLNKNSHYWKSSNENNDNIMYEITGNRQTEINNIIIGTYVCEDLILAISTWISDEFYVKCNNVIKHYYINEFKSLSDKQIKNKIKEIEDKYITIIDEKNEEIKFKDDKIDYLISQNNVIIDSNKQLLKLAEKQNIKLDEIGVELEETNYKLDTLTETVEEVILPDRNISPSDINLKHNLVIYKINNAIKIIRAQNKYINKNNIPINDIIIKEYVPNPIDFINRMKLYCNETNKKFKKDLKKNNKSISNEDFIELYDSNKKMEIKYNNVFLNNSKMDHIIELFNKLKE
ncbi:N1R/p28-like protein [Choristoneura biennis entomopoxvirus]|uniref:N1R/p28-like protein n=1 Tax=Choristoneura biennis entomopoxvirus TaxID=10288 RepID=A0A916KPI0_CBEPV|nr:N1R/p28-like protein [Choristoneura biennis entomopoxvirus]CCU55682.1 N1R/p28-like protein [Choristoneura biennis entomopoxvirus]